MWAIVCMMACRQDIIEKPLKDALNDIHSHTHKHIAESSIAAPAPSKACAIAAQHSSHHAIYIDVSIACSVIIYKKAFSGQQHIWYDVQTLRRWVNLLNSFPRLFHMRL